MSHKFEYKVLDLVKQKGFYSYEYEYMSGFDMFKERLPKKGFIVPWPVKK